MRRFYRFRSGRGGRTPSPGSVLLTQVLLVFPAIHRLNLWICQTLLYHRDLTGPENRRGRWAMALAASGGLVAAVVGIGFLIQGKDQLNREILNLSSVRDRVNRGDGRPPPPESVPEVMNLIRQHARQENAAWMLVFFGVLASPLSWILFRNGRLAGFLLALDCLAPAVFAPEFVGANLILLAGALLASFATAPRTIGAPGRPESTGLGR